MNDRNLVEGLLKKEGPAEQFFYQTYRPRFLRIATYILGYRDAEIEDVVQEAFVAALRDLPGFQFRSSLVRWMNRICVFRCYERIRTRQRQVASLDDELERLSEPHSLERDRQKRGDQERDALLEVVRSQHESMGKPCREVLDLRDRQGKNYGEISRVLKVPIGTVMSRLARCRKTLTELVRRAAKRRGLLNG